ncbi:MAG: hypothetical protein ACC682_05025 [Gemmatimonadota bacterium]
MSVILFIAAVLLLGGTRGFLWSHLRARRFALPAIRSVSPEKLPDALAPIFEVAERELSTLGFVCTGARQMDSIDRHEGPRPERVYEHAESGAVALVGPPPPGTGDRPFRVGFVSRLRDGGVVTTLGGPADLTPGVPAAWERHNHDVNDLRLQWTLHLHALALRGGLEAAAPVAASEWNELESQALAVMLGEWERDGLTRRVDPREREGEPVWRFRARPAWTMARTLLAGQRRVRRREAELARHRARRAMEPSEPARDRARAASMAWGYEYTVAARRSRQDARSSVSRWGTGLVSGGACLAVFGLWFGWELALLLGTVLLIHEMGHVAGMAAFGYRDRRILFLPFFGAAALGEKDDATLAQQTTVLLLGPVPGLLIGIACLYLFFETGGLWWLALSTTALVVNYFNLLPISPLDGGRIVETLLLGRYPRAQVVFLGGGTLTLAVGAWLFLDPILAGMALALTVSLKSAWAAAKGVLRVRARIDPHMTPSERIQKVFETLHEAPFGGVPAAQRVRLASIIVPRLGVLPARPKAAIAGALIYAGLLIGTPLVISASVYSFQPELWELMVSGIDRPAERDGVSRSVDRGAVPYGERDTRTHQVSRVSISEASLVGN